MEITNNLNKIEEYLINRSSINLVDFQEILPYLNKIRNEAIDYAHSSTLLKEETQKTIFKLNDALKEIEEDEDFFLDQEVEWNKQKSFIEGKINALTNL